MPTRRGGIRYKLPGTGGSGEGRCPNVWHMFLSFSVVSLLHKLTLSDQAPNHSATESQSLRFSIKTFSRSALVWGSKKFFSPQPEPVLGGPTRFAPDMEL